MKNFKSGGAYRLLLVLLCSLLLPVAVIAQSAGSGSISGTLSDPSGAVVAGALVEVRNLETGQSVSVLSNASGAYLVPFLQPGKYQISASKEGFGKALRTGIELEVGHNVTANVILKVTAAAESVTVTGEAPAIDVSKVEVSEDLDKNGIENLPLIGRRWDNFALTTPAASPDGGLVSYRGISGLYNLNMVDGANNNQAFFSEARGRSSSPYGYGMDTIEEFQVNTSNYSAEFGQAAGGIVNAVTKSGTNNIHGDLFYYLRYPALNALDPYAKSQGIKTQAIHQQQDFGGTVGGPVIKDKLFYFGSYNGFRKSFPVAYTSTGATAASPGTPATFTPTCPNLDPKMAASSFTSSQCTAIQNFVESRLGAFGRVGKQDVYFGKLDYQLNQRNRLSANFNWNNYHTPDGYSSGSTINNSSLSTNGAVNYHNRFLIGSWSTVINNSLVNKVQFQWARDLETAGANSGGPSVSVLNLTGYGMPNALPRRAFPDEHRLQFSDTLSQTWRNHQIKYGADLNFIHELLINLYQGGGLYNYTGNITEWTGPNSTGTKFTVSPFEGWALDVVGASDPNYLPGTSIHPNGQHYLSFAQVTDPITGVGKDDFYNNDYAFFVEDSWKVAPNFTLNLGVRYDVQTVPQPNRPNNFDALTTQYTTKINIPKGQVSPRLGFSYAANDDVVFRGGFGMFYAKTSNSTFYAIRVENGVYQQTFNCKPTTCPDLSFPNVIFTPPGQAPAAPFAGAVTPQVTPFTPPNGTQLAHGLTRNFVNPVVYESNIAMENRLPGNVILTFEGMTSRGQHLPVFVDANLAPATTTKTYALMSSGGTSSSPATQLSSITVPFYTQRIDPNMGVVLIGKSTVKSWYNAFVVSARKPFSKGLEAQLYYTWGKSLDQGAVAGQYGTFYGTDSPVDPANQAAEKGYSDNDQRHRFITQLVYKPEFKGIGNRVARYMANGWIVASNITLATGQPIAASVSGYPSGGPDGGLTGGEVSNSGGAIGGRPAQYMRNSNFLPGMEQVDLRIGKDLPITEKIKMQVLAEAFNLFNQRNIFSENATAYSYNNVGGSAALCPSSLSGVTGCLNPSPTFKAVSSTTGGNGLYTARQLQMSAKIIF